MRHEEWEEKEKVCGKSCQEGEGVDFCASD
jgi:hypothetical protein